ncbi:MAG: 50S ribosomal protein L25 [Desulfatibacillum sp.]|nr:50S ribosomal protein L25 [Desulfatibacillum sp.]
MKTQDLNASPRSTRGNSPARALRREGFIPAVLYGPNTEPVSISVSHKELADILQGVGSSQIMFNLQIEGAETPRKAMIKELQRNNLNQRLLHADFYEISMDRKLHVFVPVVLEGKCKGVEEGGMLQVIRRELEVICFPGNIPEEFVLDVTNLEVGEAIHLSDIPVGEGVHFPESANFTVVTLVAPTAATVGGEGEEEEEEAVAVAATETEAE